MIVTGLSGGLGNQMFQYAAGLSLARRNGDVLGMDAGAFGSEVARSETARALGLSDFNVSGRLLPPSAASRWRYPRGAFSRAARFVRRKVLRRYYVDWHPEVLNWKGDVYMEGYFQTEKYFQDVADEVRGEFKLRQPLADAIDGIQRRLVPDVGTPVSLHVRRGDYISARHAPVLAICTVDYYRAAMESIVARVPDARFVVFSDDIDWCRINLPEAGNLRFVSGLAADNGDALRPSQEMVLMSQCRHHIIANSTFSWWGAYLNPRSDKIVIAPAKWANGSEFSYDSIVPPTWTRLGV